MPTVCLDTNVLIWGFRKIATPGQEHMIARTTTYLKQLELEHSICLVPPPVVAELLMAVDKKDHRAFVADLSARFAIPPIDARTSELVAQVWRSKYQLEEIPRNEQKYDSLIIACALASGATYICTNDRKLRNMAAGHIECQDVPEMQVQEAMEFPF